MKKWRLIVLSPTLLIYDQLSRIIFVHAFFKAWRQPTSECIWVSPERVSTSDL